MSSLNRLHTIIDIDKGRIPDNPRLLGGRIPQDNYASNPFYFGASNVRTYRRVKGDGIKDRISKAKRLGYTPSCRGKGACCKSCQGGGLYA